MWATNRLRSGRVSAIAAAAILVTVAACGSDSSDGGATATDQSAEADQEEDTADEVTETDDAADTDDSDEGDSLSERPTHALGETSDPVPYEAEDYETGEVGVADIEVTVGPVDIGEHADLGDGFDPEAVEGMRPVAVHVNVAHVEGDSLPFNRAGANLKVVMEDEETSTDIRSLQPLDFPGACPRDTDYDTEELPEFGEADKCVTQLIPEDTEPSHVQVFMEEPHRHQPDENTSVLWTLDSTDSP